MRINQHFYLTALLLIALLTVAAFKLTDKPVEKPVYKPPDKVMTYKPIEPSRGGRTLTFEATAYDLSIQCCGKAYGHPARGITASGYNLNNMTREQAMTIGSNDFPLGTELELVFDEPYSQFNGIYTVRDTGNMKPGVLDVFVGDYGEEVSEEAVIFGRQTVKVEIGGPK
jgi:3D (Asp-Asp-Asp) domain-containing protein